MHQAPQDPTPLQQTYKNYAMEALASSVPRDAASFTIETQADSENWKDSHREGDRSIELENGATNGSQHHATTTVERPPPWMFKGFIVMVALVAALLGYDIGNVTNIQAPIHNALGRIELLPWVGMSMVTGAASAIPLWRALSGVLNFRLVMRIALVLFAAGSALGGAAPSIETLIVGRLLIGAGLTGIYQTVLSYVSVLASPESQPRIMGVIGGQWALGLLAGPLVGAAFAENAHTTWRWSMYINIPFLAVLVAGTFIFFPSYRAPYSGSALSQLVNIDWVGWVLHSACIVLINVALSFSGNIWPWNSGPAISTWAACGAVVAAYAAQQYFSLFTRPSNRAFYGRLLRIRTVWLAALGTCVATFSYCVTMYYLPLFFAFARGLGATSTAVHFLPFLCVFITSAIASGALLPVVKRYAVFYLLSGGLILIAAALLSTVTPDTPEARVMGYEAIMGLGFGLVWFNGLSIANAVVPPADRFDAAALFNFCQFGSTGLGLGIVGCLYQNIGFSKLQESIGPYGFADTDIREALAGLASPLLSNGDPMVVSKVVLAVTSTMAKLFYLPVAAGAVLLVVSLLMKWEKLEFRRRLE